MKLWKLPFLTNQQSKYSIIHNCDSYYVSTLRYIKVIISWNYIPLIFCQHERCKHFGCVLLWPPIFYIGHMLRRWESSNDQATESGTNYMYTESWHIKLNLQMRSHNPIFIKIRIWLYGALKHFEILGFISMCFL